MSSIDFLLVYFLHKDSTAGSYDIYVLKKVCVYKQKHLKGSFKGNSIRNAGKKIRLDGYIGKMEAWNLVIFYNSKIPEDQLCYWGDPFNNWTGGGEEDHGGCKNIIHFFPLGEGEGRIPISN
jgi:hypothetical protein